MTEYSLKLKQRKKNFKKKTNREDSIQKRTKTLFTNSSNKREQLLLQKRKTWLQNKILVNEQNFSVFEIQKLVQEIFEGNQNQKINSLKMIKTLCLKIKPPYKQLFSNGIDIALSFILKNSQHEYILIEALYVLNHLTIGNIEQTELLYQSNIIEVLIQLISNNKNPEIIKSSLLCLGNILSDSTKYCKDFLKKKYLNIVMKLFFTNISMEIIQAGVWVLLNICPIIPESNKFDITSLLRIFNVLLGSSNEKIFKDSCFGIKKLARSSKIVNYLFEEGTISTILSTVKGQTLSSQMRHYLLLALGQIIKIASFDQLLLLMKLQIFQNLHHLFLFHFDSIFGEALIKIMVLFCKRGNIFIQTILHSELITILFVKLKEKKTILDYGMKLQLIKLFNFWYSKTDLINALLLSKQGAIFFLSQSLLKNDEIDLLLPTLICVLKIIKYKNQQLNNLLENNGIFQLVEKNIQHPNNDIQTIAINIINKWKKVEKNFEKTNEIELETLDYF
ncbi:importin subunit alpha [Anaeramoeba flamelloides]|uniref:Importin subunit alpha n=1 Tax=Anaeramoeba flamelloides TaxID=1746091 RepID=A0AAV7Y6S5_9EUKA|nr:importin subunit alpha [Anaeramoeba flamelloides]